MADAIRREMTEASQDTATRTISRTGGVGELEIRPEHLDEIERDYSVAGYVEKLSQEAGGADPIQPLLGEDLMGRQQGVQPMSLRRAVLSSVARNLAVQVARFEPSISEAELVRAESAFDWTFFNDFVWQDLDTPQAGQGFGGAGQIARNASQSVSNSTGLRKALTTGGSFEVSQDLVYTDVRSSFFGGAPTPNPATSVTFGLALNQPLLEGFGSDVALAQVRIAQNAERAAVAQLRGELITNVATVESAYWDLVQRYYDLIILQQLLDRGVEVRDDIRARRAQDARQAQVADAAARVESRRGDVMRARQSLRRASDRLKLLINDPTLPVGGETLLAPIDTAVDEPLEFNLGDAIIAAVQNRPELDIALLSIDNASIRQRVAENAKLPTLDLRAQMSLIGFQEDASSAYDDSFENEFIDEFLLGAVFEQPIGNRGDQANYRARRLERMQAVAEYRRTAQGVVLDVKDALDAVVLNYQLIEQARTSRIAAGESLRTIGVEKRLRQTGYTVERLDIELTRQEALASAERAEIAALIDYNRSIASLYQAMGTILERNRIDFIVPDGNQLEAGTRAVDVRPVE